MSRIKLIELQLVKPAYWQPFIDLLGDVGVEVGISQVPGRPGEAPTHLTTIYLDTKLWSGVLERRGGRPRKEMEHAHDRGEFWHDLVKEHGVSHAAKHLGISRATIYRRLKEI